jgi:hypothetical protein
MTREHGTPAKYTMEGCKCVLCRKAVSDYAAHRNRLIAYGRWDPYVDAGPVRAHIEQLQAAGIGWKRVARLAGLAPSTVEKILYGAPYRGMGPSKRIRHATADKILAVEAGLDALGGAAVVDAAGTRRRLQALVAIGWSQARLARRIGVSPANFTTMLKRDRVLASRARQVRGLYEELWDTAPPCASQQERVASERAKAFAAARSWPRPMDWDDDIDDPQAQPGSGEPSDEPDMVAVERALAGMKVPLQRPELAAVFEIGAARRMSAAQIAKATGKSSRTVVRHRTEARRG